MLVRHGRECRSAAAAEAHAGCADANPPATPCRARSRLAAMTTVHLLHAGYVGDRVASSVVLVRDGDAVIVVDPGMVARTGR